MKTYCYTQTELCGLRIGTVGVNTWGDASRGNDRRVVALVGCQRKEVLGSHVDAQALYELAVLRGVVVTQRDIVEFEVVTILQEVAGDDTTAGEHVGIVSIGRTQHIVSATADEAHAILTHIENLVAKGTTEQGAQVPVLVTERVAP